MKNIMSICVCSSRDFIPNEKVARLAAAVSKAGGEVRLLSDLCEMCEDEVQAVHEVARTRVAACHVKAVKSLMGRVGEDEVECLDLRQEGEAFLQKVGADVAAHYASVTAQEMAPWLEMMESMPRKQGEDAWYPVLDKEVCCECGKCLEFCPFGVYAMVDDRIRVVHPHNCKNNCPACARTCPASAIVFPKYDRSPINGGTQREENAIQLDTKTLYNKTFKEKLALRKFKIERGGNKGL